MQLMADLITPLGAYLKLRDNYPIVLLLESSDYSSKEDSKSFLCFDVLKTFKIVDNNAHRGEAKAESAVANIDEFLSQFIGEGPSQSDGVFGYTAFDAIDDLDHLPFERSENRSDYPLIRYDFFRFVIIFDHFTNRMTIEEHCPEGSESTINEVARLLKVQDYQTHPFSLSGSESSNMTDQDYKDLVTKAKSHCQRGDVFQMVLSRRFKQEFTGDDINVYRALRSINPSPYLFYFDYGSYKIFGSSPEAQLKVEDGVAEIHPIAGTFRRTQDPVRDAELAIELSNDPKESAEHVMLVDLARNDLSKNCHDVEVTAYKQVQYFSHVIHLTSVVKGKIKEGVTGYQIFADTFPAGTLSGAPKYKAMELIRAYEPTARGCYGGGIGMIGFDGNFNHAIIIRSFLSQNNQLTYQAGAGLVISSNEQSEMEEVRNKLAALNNALELAQNI
jgi:anthranilate synthase component 1